MEPFNIANYVGRYRSQAAALAQQKRTEYEYRVTTLTEFLTGLTCPPKDGALITCRGVMFEEGIFDHKKCTLLMIATTEKGTVEFTIREIDITPGAALGKVYLKLINQSYTF